jgi:hypothetical protein
MSDGDIAMTPTNPKAPEIHAPTVERCAEVLDDQATFHRKAGALYKAQRSTNDKDNEFAITQATLAHECEQLAAAIRSLAARTANASQPAPVEIEALEAWRLVESLRSPEGASVELVCNNPDSNGQPNSKVLCCDDWTKWQQETFTGDTIIEALQAAVKARVARSYEPAALRRQNPPAGGSRK